MFLKKIKDLYCFKILTIKKQCLLLAGSISIATVSTVFSSNKGGMSYCIEYRAETGKYSGVFNNFSVDTITNADLMKFKTLAEVVLVYDELSASDKLRLNEICALFPSATNVTLKNLAHREVLFSSPKNVSVSELTIENHQMVLFNASSCVTFFPNLRKLSCKNGPLQALCGVFQASPTSKLNTIDLTGNKIESIPNIFWMFSGLRHLILANNQIGEITPKSPVVFPVEGTGQYILDIRNNPITSLHLSSLQRSTDNFLQMVSDSMASVSILVSFPTAPYAREIEKKNDSSGINFINPKEFGIEI